MLYAGEERIENRQVLQEIDCQEPNILVFHLTMRHGGHRNDLRLVPVYEDGGERPDEAIVLTRRPAGH